jgi:hypothetical protein
MTPSRKKNFVAIAREAWGSSIPDWVLALATRATNTTLSGTAKQVKASPSAVSHVLSNSYGAGTSRIEQKVRGVLMKATVQCPILGEIGLDRCLDEQGRKFIGSSAIRTKLFHKCRGKGTPICPHSRFVKGGAGDE